VAPPRRRGRGARGARPREAARDRRLRRRPARGRAAQRNLRAAGLEGLVELGVRALDDAAPPPSSSPGLVVCNPPYGERLGERESLGPLYAQLGDVLRRRFVGWTAHVLCGDLELARHIGLRPAARRLLYNGAIECRLVELPIAAHAPRTDEGPAWRRPRPPDPAVRMFQNRLAKNLRHLGRWAAREGISSWRVYDADLPEYAVAIDLYDGAAHVQEYAPPSTVEAARAAARLTDLVAVVPETLGIAPEEVFVKVRRRQRGGAQYGRQGARGVVRRVREGGLVFEVNLSDYLDTGLFLDERRVRALVRELAAGRRVLNLFAYTGAASVYAAAGGARSTVSVDLSQNYLDWAGRNFALNGVRGERVRADCLPWLARERGRFGLIFIAPPTFSNSKRMEGTFDVQRDHVALLRAAAARLEPDGVILFSNHLKRFKMDIDSLREFDIENITNKTIPKDFARSPRIHNAWRLTLR
jgi:23S rRNA (guanine2445-N2)-methyltransferase / 23S rRNA (guanine2069-N7)-methyltransferase